VLSRNAKKQVQKIEIDAVSRRDLKFCSFPFLVDTIRNIPAANYIVSVKFKGK